MPIEPETFKQIIELPPNNILDLAETVMTAILANRNLAVMPNDKISVACVIMGYTNKMLEQCGCSVHTLVASNIDGTKKVKYESGNGWSQLHE